LTEGDRGLSAAITDTDKPRRHRIERLRERMPVL
jgi:hypothetical protein